MSEKPIKAEKPTKTDYEFNDTLKLDGLDNTYYFKQRNGTMVLVGNHPSEDVGSHELYFQKWICDDMIVK